MTSPKDPGERCAIMRMFFSKPMGEVETLEGGERRR
jgi:hypothetical protein